MRGPDPVASFPTPSGALPWSVGGAHDVEMAQAARGARDPGPLPVPRDTERGPAGPGGRGLPGWLVGGVVPRTGPRGPDMGLCEPGRSRGPGPPVAARRLGADLGGGHDETARGSGGESQLA